MRNREERRRKEEMREEKGREEKGKVGNVGKGKKEEKLKGNERENDRRGKKR